MNRCTHCGADDHATSACPDPRPAALADLKEVLANVRAAIERIKQTKILSGGVGYIDANSVPLELHKACQALAHMVKDEETRG